MSTGDVEAFEELEMAMGDKGQKDVASLLVGRQHEQRAQVVLFGLLNEPAKAHGVALEQSADTSHSTRPGTW